MQDVGKKRLEIGRGKTFAVGVSVLVIAGTAVAQNYTGWSAPVSAEAGSDPALNTPYNDGCPILSPDGLTLYMATNRPGSVGNLLPSGALDNQNIWVARRTSTTAGWGAPEPLAAPINSPADDFCPTPVRGRGLYFVSKRLNGDGSGDVDGDIYFARQTPDGEWEAPVHFGPNINSPNEEWSPSFYEDEQGRPVLYFSRNVPGTNNHDIYYSVDFGPAQLATGGVRQDPDKSDARPNVRKDGREIVWDSNRQGLNALGVAHQDIWTATRASTSDPWGPAVHLVGVSSPANDTRASLSWDGSILLVGSTRSQDINGVPNLGGNDIYVSTRAKVKGGGE